MSRSRPDPQFNHSTPRWRWLFLVVVVGLATFAAYPHDGFGQQPVIQTEEPKTPDTQPNPSPAAEQEGERIAETTAGQFFTIEEPIRDDTIEQLQAAARPYLDRMAQQGERPILVFEIRPGSSKPGQSRYGACHELAEFLSLGLKGAKQTVAYVPESLSGYAVLAALACDEIVMGPEATLGPISMESDAGAKAAQESAIRVLAQRTGRDPDLLVGMLRPEANLRKVRTADGRVHYILAENLEAFRASRQTLPGDEDAWQGGRRGKLNSREARERGLARLIAENRQALASVYRIRGKAASDDPTLGDVPRPVWIKIDGRIDEVGESYIRRKIEEARSNATNLIIFEINSMGGLDHAADNVADAIDKLSEIKTIAYVNDRALGVATLVALACDQIYLAKTAQIGELRGLMTNNRGNLQILDEDQTTALAERAAYYAQRNGHPVAVAQAMVDPSAVVVEAKDSKTGDVALVLQSAIDAEPGRYTILARRKESGKVLRLDAAEAQAFELSQEMVENPEQLKASLGLKGVSIRVDGPTWVDSLVTTLNTPWMSWLLLFIGMFMLVLELKLPGIGLPAIISALAFLLFFWSRYLSGTADQLEIILFIVGLICLALELFVFPGFGVFGMSGILLILASIVMASHTFIWPTQEYEYRQMGQTLLQIVIALAAVGGAAIYVGKRLPTLPLFRRLVLTPEPAGGDPLADVGLDPSAKPLPSGETHWAFLHGEEGYTTTTLRPAGKARFGESLVDVVADGDYIESGCRVEVIDVQGARVIVKRA